MSPDAGAAVVVVVTVVASDVSAGVSEVVSIGTVSVTVTGAAEVVVSVGAAVVSVGAAEVVVSVGAAVVSVGAAEVVVSVGAAVVSVGAALVVVSVGSVVAGGSVVVTGAVMSPMAVTIHFWSALPFFVHWMTFAPLSLDAPETPSPPLSLVARVTMYYVPSGLGMNLNSWVEDLLLVKIWMLVPSSLLPSATSR